MMRRTGPNRAKHGIGFEEAKVIFASPVLTAPG